MLDFHSKARELLVASRVTPEQPSKVATFHADEEPSLVPLGYYAVVTVELKPFKPVFDTLEIMAEAVA